MYQRLALSAHYLVHQSELELQEPRRYLPRPYLLKIFLWLPGNDMVDFGSCQRIEKVPFEVSSVRFHHENQTRTHHTCGFGTSLSGNYWQWHDHSWQSLGNQKGSFRKFKYTFTSWEPRSYSLYLQNFNPFPNLFFLEWSENSGGWSDRQGEGRLAAATAFRRNVQEPPPCENVLEGY